MKVVLVHDWLIHMRGGERVLEALAELYPEAPIYTLFCDRSQLSPLLAARKIRTSFLQYVPGIKKIYRYLLPLLPFLVGTLRLPRHTDLVISSSHCVIKAVKIPSGARHICYCHTPMRYVWGFYRDYFSKVPAMARPLLNLMLEWLRRWDRKTAVSVDQFVANSNHVRQRILKFYGRDAEVIYPPVDTQFFHSVTDKKDYYLVVSAFVPYKRVDIVIEAFNRLARKLFVVGSGPLENQYRQLSKSPHIFFLLPLPRETLREMYSGARALIFPTEEDFGMVPVEAQACGTPVIAFGKGGALEGVQSGVFFEEQTPEAVCDAVQRFEALTFEPSRVAAAIADFGYESFLNHFQKLVERCVGDEKKYVPE